MIFASVTPVSDYHKDLSLANERTPGRPLEQIQELNEWMKSYCARQGCTYLDYFSGLVDGKGQLTSDMGDDGLHPNAKGYRVMAPLASAAIQRSLGAQRTAAPAPDAGKTTADAGKPKGR